MVGGLGGLVGAVAKNGGVFPCGCSDGVHG